MGRKISIASAKDKGRRLQKWVCEKISEITGFEHGSDGDDKPIESRGGGQSGVDVRLEPEVKKLFPFLSRPAAKCPNLFILMLLYKL